MNREDVLIASLSRLLRLRIRPPRFKVIVTQISSVRQSISQYMQGFESVQTFASTDTTFELAEEAAVAGAIPVINTNVLRWEDLPVPESDLLSDDDDIEYQDVLDVDSTDEWDSSRLEDGLQETSDDWLFKPLQSDSGSVANDHADEDTDDFVQDIYSQEDIVDRSPLSSQADSLLVLSFSGWCE